MQQRQVELIDVDFYCHLLEQSQRVEIRQEGELNLHKIIHPERGLLTAVQSGRYVLLVTGDYSDVTGTAPGLETLH